MADLLLALPMQMQIDMKRSADELAQTERPWEPFDELVALLGAACKPGPMWRTHVPWRLYQPLQRVTMRAKNTCGPRNATRFIHLHLRHLRLYERRSAIERLGDLAT